MAKICDSASLFPRRGFISAPALEDEERGLTPATLWQGMRTVIVDGSRDTLALVMFACVRKVQRQDVRKACAAALTRPLCMLAIS